MRDNRLRDNKGNILHIFQSAWQSFCDLILFSFNIFIIDHLLSLSSNDLFKLNILFILLSYTFQLLVVIDCGKGSIKTNFFV